MSPSVSTVSAVNHKCHLNVSRSPPNALLSIIRFFDQTTAMEDDNSLAERILRTIETILNEDTELATFDIINAEHNEQNKSPVRHEQHNLGVESWCVKYFYQYAYSELLEHRPALRQKKCTRANMNRLLIGVLLVNPDVSTFWNMKRELVLAEQLAIESELRFSNICLSFKSKSNEAFMYKRWLLGRLLAKFAAVDLPPPYDNLLQNELNVSQLAANHTQNNYHAWSHRVWSMENLTQSDNLHLIISEELRFANTWILNHVSEHFGYHYKQYLINLILNRNTTTFVSNIETHYRYILQHLSLNETAETAIEDRRNFGVYLLGKALSMKYLDYFVLMFYNLLHQSSNWSDFESEHESAWYHRRSLVYHIMKAAYACNDIPMNFSVKIDDSVVATDNIVDIDAALFKYNYGEKEPKQLKKQLDKVESSNLYKLLLKTEKNFIDTTKRRSELEIEFAQKHKKWLKLALGIVNL